MPIRVHCPSCDDRFVTSRRYRGKRVRCPVCRDWIKIRASGKTGSSSSDHSTPEATPRPAAIAGQANRVGEPTGGQEDLLSLLGESSTSGSAVNGLDGDSESQTLAGATASEESSDGSVPIESGTPAPQVDTTPVENAPPQTPNTGVDPATAPHDQLDRSESAVGSDAGPVEAPQHAPAPGPDDPLSESSHVLEAGFEEDPALTSDVGLLAMDLEQSNATPANEVVPLDEPLNGTPDGSQDVLAFLAASGGPEKFRAGATYKPRAEPTSESLSGDEPQTPHGENDSVAAATSLLRSTPDHEPDQEPGDQAVAPAGRSHYATTALVIGAVAVGLLIGVGIDRVWVLVFGGGPPDLRTLALARSEGDRSSNQSNGTAKPRVIKPDAANPYADVVVKSAQFVEQRGWFATSRTVEISLRNAGESTLQGATVELRLNSGIFDSAPVATQQVELVFDSGLAPGATTERAIPLASDTILGAAKLPPNTRLEASVVGAER